MEKEKKYRRLRETIGYIISLIWDVFKYVLFVLLPVAAIIVEEVFGIIAKVVIFIVSLYFISFLIFEAMKRKSEPDFKDLFKFDTFFFFVICFVITAIIRLCCLIAYHV